MLFGSVKGNYSGDHSADLAKVDATNDTMDKGIVALAKRMAKLADPHIRPVRVDGYGEFYVFFMGSYPFRDLKSDMTNQHMYAGPRDKSNPLWTDNDFHNNGLD